MRRSNYGKELFFLWEGKKGFDKIKLHPTSSTLQISETLKKKIKSEWNRIIDNNPYAWDAPKWRTEFVHENSDFLNIYISPINYSQHNVMRKIQNKPMQFYPNPLTINTLQETADGYILLGVKGKASDQKGLGLVGAGFVERRVDSNGNSREPEPLGYNVQKECLQETKFDEKNDFYINDATALCVIFGSNHDTTVGFHLPLFASSKEISINNEEHDDLILLPTKNDDIYDILNEGSYKGIAVSDHVLGCLESYVKNFK